MPEPNGLDLEFNEVKWWSKWARLEWIGTSAYVMTSSKFKEQFFNRAGFLRCQGIEQTIPAIEAKFRSRKMTPTILVSDECATAVGSLLRMGFDQDDSMSVMKLERPRFRENASLSVKRVGSSALREWSKAYLLSFYGHTKLLPSVSKIVEGMRGRRDVVLLMGTLDGRVAGVLAIQRSKGLAGVYCVGTLHNFRKMGVAGTMITNASRIAESEGRTLVLQTLESDGVEDFYSNGGFRRLFAKKVFSRKLKARAAAERLA